MLVTRGLGAGKWGPLVTNERYPFKRDGIAFAAERAVRDMKDKLDENAR
jgi:hypothetical protein